MNLPSKQKLPLVLISAQQNRVGEKVTKFISCNDLSMYPNLRLVHCFFLPLNNHVPGRLFWQVFNIWIQMREQTIDKKFKKYFLKEYYLFCCLWRASDSKPCYMASLTCSSIKKAKWPWKLYWKGTPVNLWRLIFDE